MNTNSNKNNSTHINENNEKNHDKKNSFKNFINSSIKNKQFIWLSLIKFFIVFLVIALDLITKQFFYKTNHTIIPLLIGFREVSTLNTGGAWGILGNSMGILVAITVVAIVAFCVFDIIVRKTNIVYSLSVSFLMGGAIGNLVDRIALGGVRDFIFFPFMPTFPTFNLADTFIFIGAVLLFVFVLFLNKPKKVEESAFLKNDNTSISIKNNTSNDITPSDINNKKSESKQNSSQKSQEIKYKNSNTKNKK